MLATRRSLSLRLIVSMGLLSLIASTILAAVQLHFKYESNIAAVRESLDQVAAGDLVVVLEAMKMQNEIKRGEWTPD